MTDISFLDSAKAQSVAAGIPIQDEAQFLKKQNSGSNESTNKIDPNNQEKLIPTPKKLGIITMKDIENYEPDPTLYLVGEGHIVRGRDRIHLLVGYAGIGKTRASSFLAYCGSTGETWFDYEIKHRFKTLFIQLESGMPRLKRDFDGLTDPLKEDVFFLDQPCDASFQDPDFRNQVRDLILQYEIGMVIIDPWTNMAADTNHKDYNHAINGVFQCLPENPKECPAVVVVAHLRKPDGNARLKRGAELMHEVNGAQVLTSRSRFVLVMERADPADDSDDRILVTCAKANDALEMPKSCHRRGKVKFTPVDDYDWNERDLGQKAGRKTQFYLSDVVELITKDKAVTSGEWKKLAKDELGMGASRFYEFQREAVSKERVTLVRKGLYQRLEG
jgi:hypothetical protein